MTGCYFCGYALQVQDNFGLHRTIAHEKSLLSRAVRRTIATEPWTLSACFLYTTISLNGAPWCNTGPKYSFSHTTKFFARVVSASCSNPLSVSFSDWPPVITEWMNTLLPFPRKYLSASFSNM